MRKLAISIILLRSYLRLFRRSTVLLHAEMLLFHTNTYNAMIACEGF